MTAASTTKGDPETEHSVFLKPTVPA